MPRTITGINDTKDIVQILIQVINNEKEEKKVYEWATKANWGDRYENTKLHLVVNCYKESLNTTSVGKVTRDGKVLGATPTKSKQTRKEITMNKVQDTKTIVSNLVTFKNSDETVTKQGYQTVAWENKARTARLILIARSVPKSKELVVTFVFEKNGIAATGEAEVKRYGEDVEDAYFVGINGGTVFGAIPKEASTKASRIVNNLVNAGYIPKSKYIVR